MIDHLARALKALTCAWRRKAVNTTALPEAIHAGAAPLKITDMAVLASMQKAARQGAQAEPLQAYSLPKPAPGVLPSGAMAMDSMPAVVANLSWAAMGALREGLGFLGYPYLAELTQRAEYRRPSEILAKEMTRGWVTVTAQGDDKSDRVKALGEAMQRFNVQALFREAAEQDGFFGRSQIYIAMKNRGEDEDDKPLILDPRKVDKDSLEYMRVIEPVWSYPGAFNADKPLEPDFYRPQHWYVMSQHVHVSRLRTLVGREVPDILKPAYQFGGLSLSQMAKPYVDNWLRTRQSVSDLISAFSVMVLKTNMGTVLQGGAADSLLARVMMFNNFRDNRGTFVLDKDTEEFDNVSAPIAGLHELQAQAQEHMASVTGIPLVVLLGITPSGLNASSEGELQTFYAWIEAQQEHLFRPHLSFILDLLQLNEFGDIDPGIGFVFNKLWTPSDKEAAEIRKLDAETDVGYTNAGIVSPEEVRQRLAADKDGPYHGLDTSPGATPEPPVDPSAEPDPDAEPDPADEE